MQPRGSLLLAEVEKQLLDDLAHYGVRQATLKLDWSDACCEGHSTWYLDGELDDFSDVKVIASSGEPVAEGWIDFVHGGGGLPLFVFWSYLRTRLNGVWREARELSVINDIPAHIWEQLLDQSKDACCRKGQYDGSWSKDSKVRAWWCTRRLRGWKREWEV